MGLRHDCVTNLEENKHDHVTRKRAENKQASHVSCARAHSFDQTIFIKLSQVCRINYKAIIFIFMCMNRLDSLHISVISDLTEV